MVTSLSVFSNLLLFIIGYGSCFPNCGIDGTLIFPDNTQEIQISQGNVSISNCKFINCPEILVTSSSSSSSSTVNVILSNVSFYGSGRISVSGENVFLNLTNIKWENLKSSKNGAALAISHGSRVILKDVTFENTETFLDGGAIWIHGENSRLECKNCYFSGTIAGMSGGAIYQSSKATIVWDEGSCSGSKALGSGGCIYSSWSETKSLIDSLSVSSVFLGPGEAVNFGGLVALENGVKSSFTSVYFNNGSSSQGNGGCLSVNLNSEINLSYSYFSQCFAKNGSGGGLSLSNVGIAFLNGASFDSCESKIYGGGIALSVSSYVWSDVYSSVIGCKSDHGGAVSIKTESIFDAVTMSMTGNSALFGGAIYISGFGKFSTYHCSFIGNHALYRGGGIFASEGYFYVFDYWYGVSTIFQNNFAGHEGHIVFGMRESIVWFDWLNDPLLMDSPSSDHGFMILMTSNSKLVLYCNNLIISPNIIQNLTSDIKVLGIKGVGNSLELPYPPIFASNGNTGLFYMQDFETALNFKDSLGWSLGENNITLRTPPFALIPTDNKSIMNIPEIYPGDSLPSITVSIVDVFNQDASPVFGLENEKAILVQVKDSQEFGIRGESMKILCREIRETNFSSMSLSIEANPGHMTIQVAAFREIFPPIKSFYFNVTVKSCKENNAVFFPEFRQCLVYAMENNTVKGFVTVLGVIIIIACVISMGFLYRFRGSKIIRVNSFNFLSLISFGTLLSSLSVILPTNKNVNTCMVKIWLENLGFMLAFGSIILKLFRISRVFSAKVGSGVKSIGEPFLLRILGVLVFTLIIYLSSWTVADPKTSIQPINLVSKQVFQGFICVGKGSQTFDVVNLLCKVMLQVVAGYFAFSIRNVPSDFNESKLVSIVIYVWIIFGAVTGSLAIFMASVKGQEELWKFISQFSILIPNGITLSVLIMHRIGLCYKESRQPAK